MLAAVLFGCTPTHPPGLGPDATALDRADVYLQTHQALSFHALQPFYTAQATDSSCSVASVAMLINALRLRSWRSAEPVGEDTVLGMVGDPEWTAATGIGGDGVTFAAFQHYLRESLDAFGFRGAEIEVFRPQDDSPPTRRRLREILARNDGNGDDFVLAAFDQGTLTGGGHFGHISPIGAYDSERHRVLVLDVDHQSYPPYWSSEDKLLEAMLVPDPSDPGGSGLIHVHFPGADGRTAQLGAGLAR